MAFFQQAEDVLVGDELQPRVQVREAAGQRFQRGRDAQQGQVALAADGKDADEGTVGRVEAQRGAPGAHDDVPRVVQKDQPFLRDAHRAGGAQK